MRLRRMSITVEWMQNEDPAKIEQLLRQLAHQRKLPPFSFLNVNIDHKNLFSKDIMNRNTQLPNHTEIRVNGKQALTYAELFGLMGKH